MSIKPKTETGFVETTHCIIKNKKKEKNGNIYKTIKKGKMYKTKKNIERYLKNVSQILKKKKKKKR